MNGTKWSVFDQNDHGVVLYPVHDACLFIMRKMAHQNLQRAKPDSLAKYTSLESYYETLIRVHERLTEYSYEEYSDQEQDHYEPYHADYGRYKLEYEHGYYGAARFADGFTWDVESGWEVGNCPHCLRPRLNLTNIESGSAPTSSRFPDSRPIYYDTYSPFKR